MEMNFNHLERLCREFGLGIVIKIDENHEGVLNRNYVLTTDKGKYFIKSVRDQRKSDIPYIAAVEELMHTRGIPAVCMRTFSDDKKYVEYDSHVYTVYDFLESNRTHKYLTSDFHTMGEMLGNIHRAGNTSIPDFLKEKVFKEKLKEDIVNNLKSYKQQIESKEWLQEIDKQFLEYIDLKMDILSKLDTGTKLQNDTLVHGDYHTRNLLINDKREIIGICDWEKAEMAPRTYELARSVQLACFNGESEEEPHIYEEDFAIEAARNFIHGYSSVYPIRADEILLGLEARFRRMVSTFWIEDAYYLRNDSRSNKFIAHEMRQIRDFSGTKIFDELKLDSLWGAGIEPKSRRK